MNGVRAFRLGLASRRAGDDHFCFCKRHPSHRTVTPKGTVVNVFSVSGQRPDSGPMADAIGSEPGHDDIPANLTSVKENLEWCMKA